MAGLSVDLDLLVLLDNLHVMVFGGLLRQGDVANLDILVAPAVCN